MQIPRASLAASNEGTCGSKVGATSRSSDARDTANGLLGIPILIVEDDPPSAKLIAFLLTAEGATVRIAPNAEEALLIIETFLPRLVVLDLVLPRMGGLLLAQHIKANPRLSKIVVVAATAVNGPEVERVVREAGCAAYFRKPIDTETFAAALAHCLERK